MTPPVETPVTEYMKIRRYVLNLILRSEGKSTRIPSIMELSKQFEVSRPTVSKAMKSLTEDGLVIGKPGLGCFTNPAKQPTCTLGNAPKPKVIGILMGDGMSVHISSYLARYLAALLEELGNQPVMIHFFNLTSHKPEVMIREIENEMLDVLIWQAMPEPELLTVLRGKGLKVITTEMNSNLPWNANLDAEDLGYRCGKLLLAEGRKNVVFLPAQAPWLRPLQGLQRAYREAGVELNPNLFFSDPESALDELTKLLAFRAPVDAVFNHAFDGGAVMTILQEAGVDLQTGCRVIQRDAIRADYDYCGITFEPPFSTHARQVSMLMDILLQGEEPADTAPLAKYPLEFLERRQGVVLRRESLSATPNEHPLSTTKIP